MMPKSRQRYDRLLKELPLHNSAQKALLASGFSAQTARTQSKKVLQSMVKYQAEKILELTSDNKVKGRRLMSEILGIEQNQLFDRLKWLALENDKDAGTALKILAPLVKQHGVILSADDDASKVVVPVLNLSFGNQPKIIEGQNTANNIEVEPSNDSEDLSSTQNGSVEP